MRSNIPILAFLIVIILLLGKGVFIDDVEIDTGIYYSYSSMFEEGLYPYSDFSFEYPPGAFLILLTPALLSNSAEGYKIIFSIFIALALFSCGIIIYMSSKSGLIIFTAAVILIPSILIFQRFDTLAAALTLSSLVLFSKKKHLMGSFLLALAASIKLYPAIIFPIYAMHLPKEERLDNILAFIIGLLIMFIPFFAFSSPAQISSFLNYHIDRPVQIESTWASLSIIFGKLGEDLLITGGFGSMNIISESAQFFGKAGVFLFLAFLSAAYYYLSKKEKNEKILFTGAFILIAGAIAFSKVFSPQYIIWLIVIFPLIYSDFKKDNYILWAVFAEILILTHLIYPVFYRELIMLNDIPVLILIARNVLFLILIFLASKDLFGHKRE